MDGALRVPGSQGPSGRLAQAPSRAASVAPDGAGPHPCLAGNRVRRRREQGQRRQHRERQAVGQERRGGGKRAAAPECSLAWPRSRACAACARMRYRYPWRIVRC